MITPAAPVAVSDEFPSLHSAPPGRIAWGRGAGHGKPSISYLGWHGRGNIGDDAIYDAVRSQLPETTFIDLPHFPHERIYAVAAGFSGAMRNSPLIVGGGTVVGRRYFRRLIERGLFYAGTARGYAIGVGVEDPAFSGHNSGSENEEIRHWGAILSEFQAVSVRGPRSAELLADIGITASVSGDPALLLPKPEIAPEDGLIGINLGFGDDLWGHDPDSVASEIAVAVRDLGSKGYSFVGILMNSDDKRWTEIALKHVRAKFVHPASASDATRELARCSVAVVSRLHAGILASISATPVVSLEYQPKCRDFALSIDDARSLIRTDRVTSSAVIDAVSEAIADAPAIRLKTATEVGQLQQRLQADFRAARRQLDLSDC